MSRSNRSKWKSRLAKLALETPRTRRDDPTRQTNTVSRRIVLRGLGGAALALPFLEGLAPRSAKASGDVVPPFAIFFRQANGCSAEQNTQEIGQEPERFWPKQLGALTADNVGMGDPQMRAVGELHEHLDKLLVVRNVNKEFFPYGDGHANGALQCLTARGPVVPDVGGDSEANGESLDHRIGRELNADGRDSLFMYAGPSGGWLGGPCISYRDSNVRRSALHNPLTAYQTIMGLDSELAEELIARQASVNDLVRDQLNRLMSSPALSSNDQSRLQLHLDSIRDLENDLSCNASDDLLMTIEGLAAGYESDDGDLCLAAARAHMHIAVLATACGYTRSVAIQVGSGNDGATRYRDLTNDTLLAENYHYISHRRASHDSNGAIIPDSDRLHWEVDRNFARTFKYLVDLMSAHDTPDGKLIDCGIGVWLNDSGNGPGHSANNTPFVIAGSAGGFFKQGEYIEASNDLGDRNIARMLNTIGSAVGLRDENDQFISDFGDPALPREPLTELLA